MFSDIFVALIIKTQQTFTQGNRLDEKLLCSYTLTIREDNLLILTGLAKAKDLLGKPPGHQQAKYSFDLG